jgi:hypothetical protein
MPHICPRVGLSRHAHKRKVKRDRSMGTSGVSHLPGWENVGMAGRASTHDRCHGGYGHLAEVWSELRRRLTPRLAERSLVGRILGGRPAG